MSELNIMTLNDNWLLIDGNIADDPGFHCRGIPRENALTAQLPCFTHMYIKDHVGISWYEKTFSLSELPSEDKAALLCFEQAIFRTEIS
ncbi:MAG: hypothetical protein IKZ19_09855, partial [Clostridia bacterium]|nr:hypothetical protein [Clostridia bacterium]